MIKKTLVYSTLPLYLCVRYSLMLACWKVEPEERPTFMVLRQQLDRLLAAKMEYLDLIQAIQNPHQQSE